MSLTRRFIDTHQLHKDMLSYPRHKQEQTKMLVSTVHILQVYQLHSNFICSPAGPERHTPVPSHTPRGLFQ